MTDFTDMLGKPYALGARGPATYDCWGAVLEAGRRMGLNLPTWDTAHWGSREHQKRFLSEKGTGSWTFLDRSQTRTGDLGIAKRDTGESHVCIVVSRGYVLHAANPAGVLIEPVDRFLEVYKRATWARHE